MGVDQFLLTWNNHRSNFAEVFTQLRVQDQLVDVTLLCDGGSYPAHRLVLAACSPYFHQLFTRLPTHHPLIYLRDVKQAELEALLEFIYRGEVSVANSELTGLIKIAESLRIKGLGDVSQQQQPGGGLGGEKRSSSPASPASPQPNTPRPRKAPRLSNNTGEAKSMESNFKHLDANFASLLSPANSYGHAPTRSAPKDGFAQLMDTGGPDLPDEEPEPEDHPLHNPGWEVSLSESKLRSCLEGLEVPQTLAQTLPVVVPRSPFTPVQTKPSPGKRDGVEVPGRGGTLGRRRTHQQEAQDLRRVRPALPSLNAITPDTVRDIKVPIMKETIKTEIDPDSNGGSSQEDNRSSAPTTTTTTTPDAPLLPLYEAPGDLGTAMGELTTPLLASYRHMLSLAGAGGGGGGGEDRAFSPLIPTTVQDQQQSQPQQQQQQAPSPTNRETRSLTCQLCGATIKHIANFRRHMKQHLNPRRFPCPWCSAAFGRKDNLKTHTRKHHPAEIESQEGGGGVTGNGGQQEPGETDGDRVPTGLNGLGTRSGEDEEGGGGEDSSDHNEGLVIAEDTDEDDEEDEDSPGHTDDAQ